MKHSSPHTHPPHSQIKNNRHPLPPDLIDGEEHYEVEKVLNSRECKVRGKAGEPWHWVMDYFVKWKGYRLELNSWVREDSMDADELIDEYLAEHVDMVSDKKEDWEFYTDPRTGRKLRNYKELWDLFNIFSGHNDPSTDTKSPFEPMSIP